MGRAKQVLDGDRRALVYRDSSKSRLTTQSIQLIKGFDVLGATLADALIVEGVQKLVGLQPNLGAGVNPIGPICGLAYARRKVVLHGVCRPPVF